MKNRLIFSSKKPIAKLLAMLLALMLTAGLCLTPAMAADAVAKPSSQGMYIDSAQKTIAMYNIDGSNYVKLRDIAYLLNGTAAQVYIDYSDGTAQIITGQAYTKPDGSELKAIGTANKSASPSSTRLVVDGALITDVSVYLIDGNNWLKIRDLGQKLKFSVAYEGSSNRVIIETERLGAALLGDSPAAAASKLGAANREFYGEAGIVYRTYGSYSAFTVIRFESDYAAFLLTNAQGSAKAPAALYTDKYGGGAVWASSIGKLGAEGCVTCSEQLVFELTNMFRAENGLAALTWNASLAAAARAHSEDMGAKNYFSHTSQDGTAFYDRLKKAGYAYSSCGENIIAGYNNPVSAVDGWINSEGHRSNMLGGYTELGVGWAILSTGYKYYGTQDFGSR